MDECLYGQDVVPLNPAVREANLRNQVAPRDFPWGSTKIDIKKLHEQYVGGAFWKNLMLELQITTGIAKLRLQEFCHNGITGMPGERYFLGRISFHGVNIIPSLKG